MSALERLGKKFVGAPTIEATLHTLNRSRLLGIEESGTAWSLRHNRIERTVTLGAYDVSGFMQMVQEKAAQLSPNQIQNVRQGLMQLAETTATIFAGRTWHDMRVTLEPYKDADSFSVAHTKITVSLPNNMLTRSSIAALAA